MPADLDGDPPRLVSGSGKLKVSVRKFSSAPQRQPAARERGTKAQVPPPSRLPRTYTFPMERWLATERPYCKESAGSGFSTKRRNVPVIQQKNIRSFKEPQPATPKLEHLVCFARATRKRRDRIPPIGDMADARDFDSSLNNGRVRSQYRSRSPMTERERSVPIRTIEIYLYALRHLARA